MWNVNSIGGFSQCRKDVELAFTVARNRVARLFDRDWAMPGFVSGPVAMIFTANASNDLPQN